MLRTLLLTLLLCLNGSVSQAQEEDAPPPTPTEKQFGADTVHFTVLPTTFLTPEVARAYGIVRGTKNFLINVAVGRLSDDVSTPVRATVSGTTSDLIHRTPLDFREVLEQDAIYYIASFTVANTEQRDFRLQVTADGQLRSYDINFIKKIYVDK